METLVISVLTVLIVASFAVLIWLGWLLINLVQKERETHRQIQSELGERVDAILRNEQEELRGMMSTFHEALADLTTKIKANSLEDMTRYHLATRPSPQQNPNDSIRRLGEILSPEEMERLSTDPEILAMIEGKAQA